MPYRARVALALSIHFAAAAAGALAAQSPAGPFEPGLRWTDAAPLSAPWMPRALCFSAGGDLVLAGAAGANKQLRLLSAAPQGPDLIGASSWPAAALGTPAVAGGGASARSFALAQFPEPDAAHRRTRVACWDALAPFGSTGGPAGSPAGGGPAWDLDLGNHGAGAALLAASAGGSALVAAIALSSSGPVALRWIDPAGGAVQSAALVAGGTPRRLCAADFGARAALSAGLDLWVLGAGGVALHHQALSGATDALALSSDGRTLAFGDALGVRVLREVAGSFAPSAFVAAGAGELATRAALSADGDTLAIGWWNAASGKALRFETWDLAALVRLHLVDQPAGPSGLQNYPEAVLVSEDGARAAFGAWGQAGTEPELWLFDRSSPAPLLAVDLPGSVQALALDPSGTRVAVAQKNGHANQFATAGVIRAYDTGERDVQVLAQVRLGASADFGAHRPLSASALFVLGRPGPPAALPGVAGLLWIDPAAPFLLIGAPADAAGTAVLSLAVPSDAALLGWPVALQAAFPSPAEIVFSTWSALPLVL